MPLIKKHQTNADFALQHFGGLEGIFELAMLNNMSITESPEPGTALITKIVNVNVADYYAKKGLEVSGAEFPLPVEWRGGIGFMKITNPDLPQSVDFIVS